MEEGELNSLLDKYSFYSDDEESVEDLEETNHQWDNNHQCFIFDVKKKRKNHIKKKNLQKKKNYIKIILKK